MAGDWLKLRVDLPDDPRVLVMAETIHRRIDPPAIGSVVVGLIRLWGSARHLAAEVEGGDGLLRGVSERHVDAMGRLKGLAGAMAAAGWLTFSAEGAILPRYWVWMRDDDRARAAARDRTRRWRERRRDVTGDGAVTSPVTGGDCPRGEERRVTTPCNPPSVTVTPHEPTPDGVSPAAPGGAANGRSPRKKNPVSPTVRELADLFAGWITDWKPDAKPQVKSAASLEQLRLLVEADGRSPDDVKALLAWLFGGNPKERDYEPREPGFDWRRNVLSGAKLRKHWDVLDDLFSQSHPKEPAR